MAQYPALSSAVVLLSVLTLLPSTEAYNVLLVSTVSSPSHSIFVNALTGGLLDHGHHVTELVIHSSGKEHPNKTSFVIESPIFVDEFKLDLGEYSTQPLWREIPFLYEFCFTSARIASESQAFRDLLTHLQEKKPNFDVYIIDYVFQESFLGLNHLIGRKPVVLATAFNLPEDVLEVMGSPYFPSMQPYGLVGAHGGEPMSFLERAHAFMKYIAYKTYFKLLYMPRVEELMAKSFPGAPPFKELLNDVAVALVNTNPALHGGMPLVPAIVEVGGIQARPAKALPADLLSWVNEKDAPHGFVFMSFGTNVKSSLMTEDKIDAILRAFARLKQRVLWKYEEDDILDKLPPNVRVAKWLPQNDILGHPNIRLFVTHNGGLSSQETSYHGVPVVGVPFGFDQHGYAEKFRKMQLGRTLEYRDITEESFFDALNDVINNPKYAQNMRRLRQSLRDQKETPLERAVWWVENVARNGGAPQLRSPGLHLRWYEMWMLDVVAAIAVVLAVTLWIVSRVLRCLRPSAAAAGLNKVNKTKTH